MACRNQKQYEENTQGLILGFVCLGVVVLFVFALVSSVRDTTLGQDVKQVLVFTKKANDAVGVTFSFPEDNTDASVVVCYPGNFFVFTKTYKKPLNISQFSDSSSGQIGKVFRARNKTKISIEGYDYRTGYPLYVYLLQFKGNQLVGEYTFVYTPAKLTQGDDPLRIMFAKKLELQ